uniref:Uncharacterized protein n=1 Tax=Vitis vinifera TaxID=29760 RepID=A5AYX5_VITVI|nr:hypothetical protein VITISV_002916 [Vitis vinifera]
MARAKAGDLISLRNINPLHTTYQAAPTAKPPSSFLNIRASSKKANGFSLIAKKSSRSPKRLITISTSDGRWHGKWNSDYVFSFRELQLEDLVEEDEEKDAEVSISLCIHKVIYVKPGCEANLDSLIQDTIRLTTSVKAVKLTEEFDFADIGAKNAASIDMRWSRLLELRNANL